MKRIIPYGRQSIDESDMLSVAEVLQSEFLTQGPKTAEFERKACERFRANHAIAVNSATSALHLACLALGIGSRSLVWTSPISFVASANCARYCGADVDFVDVEPSTGNICASKLEEKLLLAEAEGRLPNLVVVVHFAGQPCDMKAIALLAKRFNVAIVEDASHAVGACYEDRPIGACCYSDITVFSFHPVKIVTSGEGGLALTNNYEYANKMRLLGSHGVTRETDRYESTSEGAWSYQQIELGFNYRMSDIHAALGLSQLAKLEGFVEQRNALARRYDEAFETIGVFPLEQKSDRLSSYHLYAVLLSEELDRSSVFDQLKQAGIGVNVHYIPIYKQPYYRRLGFPECYLEGAEKYYRNTLTLPLFPGLSAKDQAYVIDNLMTVIRQ